MATTIYGIHDDVPEEIPAEHERVSLVQDIDGESVYYQVENADGDFYLCDADGDKLRASEWGLLRVLADIPADDPDAFFEAIQAAACEEE